MKDVAKSVFDRIIGSLESGQAWDSGRMNLFTLSNPVSRSAYHGINTLILGIAMMENQWERAHFMTFNQAKKLGGHIVKGSTSETVVFWKLLDKEVDGEKKKIPLLRFYNVFNLAQIEGLPEKYYEIPPEPELPPGPEELVANYLSGGPGMIKSHKTPFYRPLTDEIGMPPLADFKSGERYYESLFHEMVHSTGHEARLKRDLTGMFNKAAYSREELIAEFGTGFLLAKTGVTDDMSNLAAYIKGWHRAIEEDPKDLIVAAGKAERAVEYIEGNAMPKEEAA